MDLKRILERIERRLKAVGLSGNAASIEAGKPDAVRNLRRAVKDGERQGLTTSTIAALAPVLRTTVPWLMEAVGPEDREQEQPTIPVWGQAGAGGEVLRFHEGGIEIDRIPAAEFEWDERTGAVEIVGDSLGMLFDRWYAIYDEVRHPPTTDLIGKLCILELADGRVFIKRLKKGRGKRFTLESNFEAPILNVEVKWAARVKNMVPK
jgi:hypothetical protein